MKRIHTSIILLIACSAVFSSGHAAEVQGVQLGTWSTAQSPIVVTGDVRVPAGMSLTIRPGVIVKFSPGTRLRVEGALIAEGKNGRRIVFTSINDNEFGSEGEFRPTLPTNRDWVGLDFAPASGSSSRLDYCIIRYAELGISAKFASPGLRHIIFADCGSDQFILNGQRMAIESGVEQNYLLSPAPAGPGTLVPGIAEPASVPAAEPSAEAASPRAPVAGQEFSFGEVTVISAARREQTLREAPAAISVISAEDIHNSGAVTIPDVLRMVPGLDVMTITTSDVVVNARGFNKEMSNKMLVLIDGRYVYWDFYGITLWDTFPINLEDIARIEVIRGPGSSLYGANAFSGVINIITKSPEELRGTHFSFTAGNVGTLLAAFTRAGGTEQLGYKVSLGVDKANRWEEPSKPSRDQMKGNVVLSIRPDANSKFVLDAGVSDGEGETFSGIGRIEREQTVSHARIGYTNRNFTANAFWYQARAKGVQEPIGNKYDFLSNTVDFEAQHLFHFGSRHSLVAGGNYRIKIAQSNLIDKDHLQEFSAFYVEDEFKATRYLTLIAGGRYDNQPLVESQLTPRAGMILSPDRNHSLRLSYTTAFRSPAFIESYLYQDTDLTPYISPHLPANTLVLESRGNPGLKPEKITSYEVGYRGDFGAGFQFRLDLFYNELVDFISFRTLEYKDLSLLQGLPPGSLLVPLYKSYTNAGQANAKGGEVSLELKPTSWLGLEMNYSYQQLMWSEDDPQTAENEKDQEIKSSPRHKANLALHFNLQRLSAHVFVHYVGRTEKYESWAYGAVDPYTLVNARIGYRFFQDRVELSLAAFNLLNKDHYQYPGFDQQGNPAAYPIGQRYAAAVMTYRF